MPEFLCLRALKPRRVDQRSWELYADGDRGNIAQCAELPTLSQEFKRNQLVLFLNSFSVLDIVTHHNDHNDFLASTSPCAFLEIWIWSNFQ